MHMGKTADSPTRQRLFSSFLHLVLALVLRPPLSILPALEPLQA